MAVPAWVKRIKAKVAGPKALQRGKEFGYRSGLEETIGAQIEADTGSPPRFEERWIPYVVPEKRHKYLADFELANGIILEGKGIFDAKDRAKHLFVKAQYPELDIRFVFSSLKTKINPGSPTTVKDWCERYGYKCCQKVVPKSWFFEEGPARKPAEVIANGPFGYVQGTPAG